MRHVLTIVFAAALTLWLGGLVALFIFVQTLFAADRGIAAGAAPVLFRVFEFYQLGLLVVALVSLTAWRLLVCTAWKKWMLGLVLLAGAMAVVQTGFLSSRMRTIMTDPEVAGRADAAAQFRRLHSVSMILYSGSTILLAIAACLLPSAIQAEAEHRARPTLPRASTQTDPA
jgi:hypothetical protein